MANQYIIAIDFGTAYSGYAFSMTAVEDEINPQLKSWGEEFGTESPKAPTCILFDEQEEFMNFGYEAKTTYYRMPVQEAQNKFFFDCFKMFLYNRVSKIDQMSNNVGLKLQMIILFWCGFSLGTPYAVLKNGCWVY